MFKDKPYVYIIGSGGHAKVLKSVILDENLFCFGGYIEKTSEKHISTTSILLESEFLKLYKGKNPNVILGIGERTKSVKSITKRYIDIGSTFPQLIHKTAVIDRTAVIKEGTVCLPLSSVKANSSIGRFCIINNNSVVGHDSEIGDFVHVSLGAVICGDSSIGSNTVIGANATVLPGLSIGTNCVIGAGAIVTKAIPNDEVWFGNPARRSMGIR